MTKQEVISVLESSKEIIRERFKAEIIGIFGSFARGESDNPKDIDFLVEFKDGAGLLDLSGLGIYLEELLGIPVDIVSKRALRKELESVVYQDLISI